MTASFRSLLLDSSVVIKWFRNETDSDKALAIQAEYLKGTLAIQISELTFYEMANALRYSGDSRGDQICDCLDSIAALGIGAYTFDLNVLESAVEASFEKGISIYDTYLIALAKAHGLTLVTADAKLFARVKGDGIVLQLSAWSG